MNLYVARVEGRSHWWTNHTSPAPALFPLFLPQPERGTDWMRTINNGILSLSSISSFYNTPETSHEKVSGCRCWLSINRLIPASCVRSANNQLNISATTVWFMRWLLAWADPLINCVLIMLACMITASASLHTLTDKTEHFYVVISFMVRFYHVDSASLCSHGRLNRC